MVDKKTRDKLIAQAKNEIQFARQYKQARIFAWQKNENMYYGKKYKSEDSRANVELGKMQGFIHTILSKIDNPLIFKYKNSKEADLKKAKRINALREADANADNWDFKDLLGKKQGVLYGRAIYCYYADSYKGYKAHLEPVDVYDFLIDPAGGGYDLELAFYMGRYGIIKSRQQIIAGGKAGEYYPDMVKQLTKVASGNATEINQEEINKQNRYFNFSQTSMRQIQNPDKYKFWEWYTTSNDDGERYYLLMDETGNCLRCELLKDIFASNMYPFWSWACFPDLTEFWTPSYADYVREIFMAQSISINQMLDNAEARNKPMKAVISKFVVNMAELKYRKDGYIRLRDTDDVEKAIMTLDVPEINTPIAVYNTLESIQQLESGVTAADKGVAEEEKVGIYEGNQVATAERFGLLNKSYANGYRRFAVLYEKGVFENLTKKVAVEILGPDGVEVEEISRKDIRPYGKFNYIIQASDAELNANNIDKKNKLTFLTNTQANPMLGKELNPKKVIEIGATIAGFTMDEIKELLDVEAWGNADLMSEAARDIERLLDGETIKPNEAANVAYKQKIVDWLRDHHENIDNATFGRIAMYIEAIEPFVMRNAVRSLNDQMSKIGMNGAPAPEGDMIEAPEEPMQNPGGSPPKPAQY